jgi:hypothetical protein
VNDGSRSSHRDRGDEKNILNEIQGAFGEIVSLIAAETLYPEATNINHNPIDFNNNIDDVDIAVYKYNKKLFYEAKCLLIKDHKSLFLVNKVAHQRSCKRGAIGYIPVLSIEGGGIALIGKITPIQDVSDWEIREFGYGDPAHSIRLRDYCPQQWEQRETAIRRELEPRLREYGSVEHDFAPIVRQSAESVHKFRRSLPNLGNCTSQDMVNSLIRVYES